MQAASLERSPSPRADWPPTFDEYFATSRHVPIYVILGVQGSGTNLLGRLLTRLFNFSVMRDRSMVFNAAARLGPSPSRADVDREIRKFEKIVSPSAFRRKTSKNIIQRGEPLKGLIATMRRTEIRSGADFARCIYSYRAFSMGASHIAIKSDDVWESVHLIDQVIPDRRIILLTRDFRDNLVSVSGKYFGPIEPLCTALYVKKQMSYYGPAYRRSGALGLHLKYETLLNSTREFVDDVARHFHLSPVVDLDVAIPALKFRPNKIGKWNRLPPEELAWCEGILQQELLEFGYALASAAPTLPPRSQLAAATARDTVKRVPQRLRGLLRRLAR